MKVQERDYVGVEIHLFNGDKHLFNTLEQAKSYMKDQGIIKVDEERVVENRLIIQGLKERNMQVA